MGTGPRGGSSPAGGRVVRPGTRGGVRARLGRVGFGATPGPATGARSPPQATPGGEAGPRVRRRLGVRLRSVDPATVRACTASPSRRRLSPRTGLEHRLDPAPPQLGDRAAALEVGVSHEHVPGLESAHQRPLPTRPVRALARAASVPWPSFSRGNPEHTGHGAGPRTARTSGTRRPLRATVPRHAGTPSARDGRPAAFRPASASFSCSACRPGSSCAPPRPSRDRTP